jgi:hypothetical protein
MTLQKFLKLRNGGEGYVSIHQLPYNYNTGKYANTYFEEEWDLDDILTSNTFKAIKNKQVDHFHVIGGDGYKVELCIYLKEEKI